MFTVGECIVYGDSDVCQIVKIGVPDMKFHQSTGKQYYFLEPKFYNGVIYAPTDTQVSMRPVISREEALLLIASMPSIESLPCASGDKKRMSEHYDHLMGAHTCQSLAQTAKSIYLKYRVPGSKPKLPNSTEASFYKKANDLLLQELSVALNESIEEVQQRIEQEIAHGEPMKWSL